MTTDVYLITGFLGSGKTTFLNRIMEGLQGRRRVAVLVNEFGEIGLDGALVHGKEFDLLEISRGSIFCVCVKTDFIRALHEVVNRIHPDLLIMESTGVADPSGLKKDLGLPIFQNRFRFVEQFCIVDAVHFEEAFHVFASVEKQIASSTVFIINKTDMALEEQIGRVKEIIRRLHPEPLFFDASHGRIPLERFFTDMGKRSEKKWQGDAADSSLEPKQRAHSLQLAAGNLQLEKPIERILNFPAIELMPPDRLISAVYAWKGPSVAAFQVLADRLPGDLVRGKGFIGEDGKICLFDMVMGKWELKPASLPKDRSDLVNRIVFIGSPVAIRRLEALSLEEPLLSKESVLDPMRGIDASTASQSFPPSIKR
jgi:G3E family GTPase